MALPVRAIVVFIAEAVPNLSFGTEPRMALWLGELKIAQPKPVKSRGIMMRGTDESKPNVAIKNWPMTISGSEIGLKVARQGQSDKQRALIQTDDKLAKAGIEQD